MSRINAETLSNLAGTSLGSVARINRGHAKAWMNLNGTGTIALRDSQNISSAVDGGTGTYSFNFTTAMANANYSTPWGPDNITASLATSSPTRTASVVGSTTYVVSAGSTTVTDATILSGVVLGDLAP